MHRFWTVLADGSLVVLLSGVLVLYGIARSRHTPRYTVPTGLVNWHDISADVAALRTRSRWWRGFVLLRRALVIAGSYVGVAALVGLRVNHVGAGGVERFIVASALVAAGLLLTVPCRRLADPMYSRPRGRTARRERHSLHGSVLRLGAAALYYPFLVYVVPLALVLMIGGAVSSVGGSFGPLGGLAGLTAVGIGLLALGAFTGFVRSIDQRGLRYRSASAANVLAQDVRPYLLYLRTFQDDAVEIRASGTSRRGMITSLSFRRQLPFEEVVAWRFQHYAPIIAGNDPNASGLATLGAAKVFLSLDPNFEQLEGLQKWQREIEAFARSSRAVLVSAAPVALQPGVRFELEMLGAGLPQHPMILIVPPDRSWSPWPMIQIWMNRLVRALLPSVGAYQAEPTVAERWSAFNDFVQRWPVFHGIRELNATGAAHLLIHVPGEGWSAWGADRRSEWTYAVSIKRAMDYAQQHWPSAPKQVTMPYLEPAQPRAAPDPRQRAGQGFPATPRGPRAVPGTIRRSIRLMYAAMVAFVPSALVVSNTTSAGMQTADPSLNPGGANSGGSFIEVLFFLLVVPLAVWLVIARRCLRGGNKARSAATVMLGLGCLYVLLIVGRVAGGVSQITTMGFLAPALWSVVLLWRKDASAYFEGAEPSAALPEAPPSGGGPDAHRPKWSEVPATVKTAIVLMCAGAAMLTAQVYAALYRVFHEAQATPANDPSAQLHQSASLMTVPYVILLAGCVMGAWAWIILECRRGRRHGRSRQRGRIAATAGFALTVPVAVWISASGPGAWGTLFILIGLAAVVLLWLPQSTPHFLRPAEPPQPDATPSSQEPPAPVEAPLPATQEPAATPAGPMPWERTRRVAVAVVAAALLVNATAQVGAWKSSPTTAPAPPAMVHVPASPSYGTTAQ